MKKYSKPEVTLLLLNIEGGLAQSSATVNPGGSNNTPNIEDWDKEEDSEEFFFNNL